MQVSIFFVRLLADELLVRGVDLRRFCAEAGIPESSLDDPSLRVDFPTYNRVVGRALEMTRDPQLGLAVGGRTPAIATTLLGHLVHACPSLREAAKTLWRYGALLLEGGAWGLSESDGQAVFTYSLPAEEAERAYGAELCFALVYGVMRSFVGAERAREVTFEHAPTGPVARYREVFGCPVRFEAPANSIRGDRAVLDRRFLLADPTLKEALLPKADGILSGLRAESALPARIRSYVLSSERPSAVTISEITSSVGVGERTLRRRLEREGVRLRDVVEVALRDLACSSLAENVPIKDVAYRLGYGDLSAFYRAFRRWTGVTPAEFQRTARFRALDEHAAAKA